MLDMGGKAMLASFSMSVTVSFGATHRNIKQYAEARQEDHILMVRIDAPLFFANIIPIKVNSTPIHTKHAFGPVQGVKVHEVCHRTTHKHL